MDALGIGGADLYIWVGNRRYVFRSIQKLVSVAKKTPVVDGSRSEKHLRARGGALAPGAGRAGLWPRSASLVSAVDRFGMAQEAGAAGEKRGVWGLSVRGGRAYPGSLVSHGGVAGASNALPIITRLPFQWFYPTGEKQEKRTPRRKSFL